MWKKRIKWISDTTTVILSLIWSRHTNLWYYLSSRLGNLNNTVILLFTDFKSICSQGQPSIMTETRGYHSRSQPQGRQSQGTSYELRHLRTFWGVRRDAAAGLSFWHPFLLWIVWNPHQCERPGCTPSHSNYKLPERRTKRYVNSVFICLVLLLSFRLIFTIDLIGWNLSQKGINCAIASCCQQRAV